MRCLLVSMSWIAVVAGCVDPDDTLGSTSQASVAVTWLNVIGVTATGNSLTKTGDPPWNAGAISREIIVGDGFMEFTTAENTTAKAAGLSRGDTDRHYSDIEFAILLRSNHQVAVYESGVQVGAPSFGTYVAGDVFRVENEGGVITYAKNGNVFHTSAATATSPQRVDTSMLTPGGTINNVVLGDTRLHWQNVVGLSVSGAELTKIGAPPWNAGASSVETVSDYGYVEFTTAEANAAKMCGLNSADTTPNYADIDFAIRLKSKGWIAVYENGVAQADNIGTYIAGDVFRVDVTAGVVTYRKNGTTFFTSAAVPTFPLAVDTSFLTTGATINAVTLVSHTGWTFAGDLAAARSSHRSDVLADGRVLVTGGSNDSPPLGTAELFDPATGVWTGTHPMVTPRVNHSTSLLDDGRLLAAGGYDPIGGPVGQPTKASELYDPVTDQWIATSPMAGRRAHFGLTTLTDGRVLASGGRSGTGISQSAALFDPATGQWTATDSMAGPRASHTSTRLADGRILVAGGSTGAGLLATAETYNPATGRWRLTDSMPKPRIGHAAALLQDGRVLIAGGSSSDGPEAAAALFDPVTRTWAATGSLAVPRSNAQLIPLLSGEVLLVGGEAESHATAAAELYDPALGTWSSIDSMQVARTGFAANRLSSGMVIVSGGYFKDSGLRVTATTELFDPSVAP